MEKKKKDKDMPVDELLEQLKLVFNIDEEKPADAVKDDTENVESETATVTDALPDDTQDKNVKDSSNAEKKKKDKKKFSFFSRKKDEDDEDDTYDIDDIKSIIGASQPADKVSEEDTVNDVIDDVIDISSDKNSASESPKTEDKQEEAEEAAEDKADDEADDEADEASEDDKATANVGSAVTELNDGEDEPEKDGDEHAAPDDNIELDAAIYENESIITDDEAAAPKDAKKDEEKEAEEPSDKHIDSAFSFLFDENDTENGENKPAADSATDNDDNANDRDDDDGDSDDGDDSETDKSGEDDADNGDDVFVYTPFSGDGAKADKENGKGPSDEDDKAGTRVVENIKPSATEEDDDILLTEEELKLKEEEKERIKKDREAALLDDVSKFDSLFDDENSEDDGYSSSEKAIMNALDEVQKPEKKKNLSFKKQADNDDDEFMSRVGALSGNTKSGKSRRVEHQGINEYTSVTQRSDFINAYKKLYDKARAALIGSSVFAVLMLVYECLALFGAKFPSFCSPTANPAVFILIDLQLFALCAAFAYKELVAGVKSIFNGSASAESLGALAALLTALYGIISAFVRTEANGLFMLPAAFTIICMLSSSLRRIKRTVLAFRITSSKTERKYVLDLCRPDETDSARAAFGEYLPDDPLMLRINRADFIEGFVERSSMPSKSLSTINIFLPVTALVFAAVFGVLLLIGKGAADSIQYAYIASMICIPAAFFTAITFPAYSASKKAFGDDSCIVSDAGADEYAGASIVSFDDSDAFPVANDKINGVKLYDENRIDHITYLTTSVFAKLGGPLKDIFDSVRAESDCCENTEITSIDYDGVAANINSEVVLIGSASYIERNGVAPGYKYTREDNLEETSGRARVMFVTANGRIVAKFYISYKADKDFIGLLKQLSETSRCVAIKTLDPNIDTELLRSDINTKKYTVEVIKCKSSDELGHEFPTSSSTVVSRHSPKALLRTLLLCDKMSFSTKTNVLICFLSVVIGLLVTLFMILSGTMDKLNSIYITLYHLVFIAAVAIATKLYI